MIVARAAAHRRLRRRSDDQCFGGVRLSRGDDAWLSHRLRRAGTFPETAGNPAVEVFETTDDAAAQEADQQHEDDAKHQFPRRAEPERRLQEVLQEQPDRRADQRAEQRAPAADRGLHHELTRGVEGERRRAA